MQDRERTTLLQGMPYTPSVATDIRDAFRKSPSWRDVTPFDDQQHQAARALLELPLRWGQCPPAIRTLWREVFRAVPVEVVARMNAGDVAEAVLQHQLDRLRKLRQVGA